MSELMKLLTRRKPVNKPKQDPAPEVSRPTVEDLQKELMEATKLVPGFENTGLRYAGNAQMGYFPCTETGAVIASGAGAPFLWPTIAHLRVWANNWMLQKSNIVIPTGGIPPPGSQPN